MAVVAQISSVFVVVAYAFRLCCSFSGRQDRIADLRKKNRCCASTIRSRAMVRSRTFDKAAADRTH
jgi:hypothetical protein